MATLLADPTRSSSGPGHRLRLGEHLVEAGLLSSQDLERVLLIQRETGEPLGRILIALGLVRRYDLYRQLSTLWDMPFVDLLKRQPDADLVRRFSLETLIRDQFVPVARMGDVVHVAVARQPDAALTERIQATLGPQPLQFLVTTDWDVEQALRVVFRRQLLDGATYGLYFRRPQESAYTVFTRAQFFTLAGTVLGLLATLYWAPWPTLIGANLVLMLAFGASIWFKFAVAFEGAAAEGWEAVSDEEVAALRPQDLPHYTILVPVYREAGIMKTLVENLRQLDYPKEKLEVLILLEEDDHETIAAAKAADAPGNFRLVVVPNQLPKTKPKACNVGLYFARGEYLVIYDAEDRPEPDQLKKVVAAFRKGPANLVCLQAALNYYNRRQNFLTRMFTLEYSYWFDYMLLGLHRLNLPIPLGGTSNHFRTDRLRELGGWDPFNVTEDADLGVRASARGYRVAVVNSTTFEEATSQLGNWIRQRSRWIKGFMQTSLVHLRNPVRLVRQLGLRRALAFFLLIGGTPLTFLAAVGLWLMYGAWIATGTHAFDPLFPPVLLYISLFNFLIGNAIAVYLGMLAVFKRRYYDLLLWSLLSPIYWTLHSVAAWKALGQLFSRPFFWEKTAHGFSRRP